MSFAASPLAFSIQGILRLRVSGWQNTDVQGICTLFRGWQGWQEGDRCPNPDKEWLGVKARFKYSTEFSREFKVLSVANVCFIGSKAPNSLENSKAVNAASSSRAVIAIGRGGSKSTCFHPFLCCVRQHLTPSCHPCHPWKRVHKPCTSAFCHPDTLFRIILSVSERSGIRLNLWLFTGYCRRLKALFAFSFPFSCLLQFFLLTLSPERWQEALAKVPARL